MAGSSLSTVRAACFKGVGALGVVLLGLAGSPAVAQDFPDVAAQSWYPEGYLDLRIAAAGAAASVPREQSRMLASSEGEPSVQSYDLVDCTIGSSVPAGARDDLGWREYALALDVSSKRMELARLGYLLEVYDQPLRDYERAALASIALAQAELTRMAGDSGALSQAQWEDYQTRMAVHHVGYRQLAADLEARRTQFQPDKPQFVAAKTCTGTYPDLILDIGRVSPAVRGPDDGFTFFMRPRNGRIRLINAFQFRVCERRVQDPYREESCGWNEYSDGESTERAGRYMYEVRWPDGTVQRGAKLLERNARGKFTIHLFNRD